MQVTRPQCMGEEVNHLCVHSMSKEVNHLCVYSMGDVLLAAHEYCANGTTCGNSGTCLCIVMRHHLEVVNSTLVHFMWVHVVEPSPSNLRLHALCLPRRMDRKDKESERTTGGS